MTIRIRPWMAMVAVVTILAGLLFGYDQGVISGALGFVADDFGLSSFLQEVVTSWVTLGALFGALGAGWLADRVGRRLALVAAAILFVAGALLEALAPGTSVLVAGRFVTGLGVGVASVAGPLYAAEMAPASSRGRFVSTYQLAITIGILVAEIVDAILSSSGDWRLMLGLAAVPGILLLVVAWVMPETPRWLVRAGRTEEARASLVKTRGSERAEERIGAMAADLEGAPNARQDAEWREVFAPSLRRALWVGVGLAVFQQVTGINAIIYYANEIFDAAGFTTPQEQADATLLAVGCVNVLATFIAIAYIDRFGRRPLLLTGLVGMGVSLTAVGLSFLAFDETSTGGVPSVVGIVTLIALVVYIASFAFSLGPVVWTVISEIYPNRVRGRAVAVATAVNWAAAFLVSQSFLSLLDAIGTTATFLLFAAMCVVSGVWIARVVPETKGRTLEEIEQIFGTADASG